MPGGALKADLPLRLWYNTFLRTSYPISLLLPNAHVNINLSSLIFLLGVKMNDIRKLRLPYQKDK